MNYKQARDLGLRAVTCGGFEEHGGCGRFSEGMLWIPSDMKDWGEGGAGDPVPDLRDGATRGRVLEMVRERWGQVVTVGPYRHPRRKLGWSASFIMDDYDLISVREVGRGATEAEALVAALEAAP